MCDELEVPELWACCWVGMVCWLATHPQDCRSSPGTTHGGVTDLMKQREIDVAGAGRQRQHATTAGDTQPTACRTATCLMQGYVARFAA
jgi:hypothetical protein